MKTSKVKVKNQFSKDTDKKGKKPNIIFILTDDQGYGDMSFHGNPKLKTPNMDALALESVRFTDFVVSPTCSPSRAALLTGMHEFRTGVTHTRTGRSNMDLNAVTIGDLLLSAGYRTGFFGKWHTGESGKYRPEHRGFEVALTGKNYHNHFDPVLIRNGVEEQHKGHRTQLLFDEAINFIETHKDEAFFCHLATYVPHDPLVAPEKYAQMYDGDHFLGMVACLDDHLGRLLARLKELELEKNTLIIFMNDNGATYGADIWNAGMRGVKTTSWYGGTRAYSFWRWPETFESGEVKALTGNIDLLPTLAEIAEVKIPEEVQEKLDGKSLLPLLKDHSAPWDDRTLFIHVGRWNDGEVKGHKYIQCGVRYNQYCLTKISSCNKPETCMAECKVFDDVSQGKPGYYSKINHKFHYAFTPNQDWALYDITSDLPQKKNIADKHSELVKNLIDKYEEWWKEVYPIIKESKLLPDNE